MVQRPGRPLQGLVQLSVIWFGVIERESLDDFAEFALPTGIQLFGIAR